MAKTAEQREQERRDTQQAVWRIRGESWPPKHVLEQSEGCDLDPLLGIRPEKVLELAVTACRDEYQAIKKAQFDHIWDADYVIRLEIWVHRIAWMAYLLEKGDEERG